VREFSFSLADPLIALRPESEAFTGIIVTDDYEGICSDGLLDGSSRDRFSKHNLRDFFLAARKLGDPVWILRSRVQPTRPYVHLPPVIMHTPEVVISLDDLISTIPLPSDQLYCITD
jgi:hypothetical protein